MNYVSFGEGMTAADVVYGALPQIGDVVPRSLVAADVVRALQDAGYLAPLTSLPSVAPSRGPRTSDTAAESIQNMSERHWSVLMALQEVGPATDEELCDRYTAVVATGATSPWVPQTPQSIRTRRKELVAAGHVEATSLLRPTRTGRNAQVWQTK